MLKLKLFPHDQLPVVYCDELDLICVCIWTIKSHSHLTGCDLTHTHWPASSTPVTHHLVQLVKKLDIRIIVVYNQDLSVW
ncbi:hypothetical protein DPMN_183585 [Dreissena polymorpha]|uniref:Uncharacterized protein n=1 Tax=Dreissena polymorpha TaxID=45954 RepID=A0A9D4I5N5_DREPO|nr:hypothetical protein DPMN_183585 [Dreissena polymorpha]